MAADLTGTLIGNPQLADALERLLWIEPNPRVLTVAGGAGAGTSTALAHAVADAEQGYRVVRVDIGQILADDARHGRFGDDPALRLMQTLAVRIAALAPGWRRGALAKEASDLDDLPDDLDVAALSGGVEKTPDTPLTIRVGDESEEVRRRWWIAGLTEVVRRLRRSRFVLVVDNAQLLGRFDPVRRAERLPGASGEHVSWFAAEVLPALLDTAPHLRVVLGGTARVPVVAVPADHLTLRPWTAEQTATYLAARGHDDADLATAVHDACGGSPLVTATLARHLPSGDDAAKQVTTLAESGSAADWLPKLALAELDDADQDLLLAAATLRVVSVPALRALCPEAAVTDTLLARLLAGWAADSYDDVADATSWRMHPLLRGWLLGYARSDSGTAERHRAAAGYYDTLGGTAEGADPESNARSVEAAYHRFAAGDDDVVDGWRDRLIRAVGEGRLGRAAALASAALAARSDGEAAATLSGVWPVASLATGYVGYLRGDLVEAQTFTSSAVADFDALASDRNHLMTAADVQCRSDRARALELRGQLDWLAWRCRDAAQNWLDALDLCRELPDDEVLVALCAAGEASLACGELLVADDVLDEAYSLSEDSDDVPEPTYALTFPRVPLATLGEVADDVRSASLVRWLGETAAALGETERAEALLDQAEERTTAAGCDSRLLSDVLRLKAEVVGDAGDLAASEALLERANVTARGCPDRAGLAQVLLAQAALERRLAESLAEEQLAEPGRPAATAPASGLADIPLPAEAPALEQLAPQGPDGERKPDIPLAPRPAVVAESPVDIASDADVAVRYRQQRAARLASAALDLAQEIGHVPVQAAALALTGNHTEALALARRIGDRRAEVRLAIDLGIKAHQAGDADVARAYLSPAADIADDIGDAPAAERARRALQAVADRESA